MSKFYVESDIFGVDPRFKALARLTKMTVPQAAGCATAVWSVCYSRLQDVLPADEIDIASEFDGFAAALVRCRLAEEVPGGVRLRGASERIAWLLDQARKGKKGALAGWAARRTSRHNHKDAPDAQPAQPTPSVGDVDNKKTGVAEEVLQPWSRVEWSRALMGGVVSGGDAAASAAGAPENGAQGVPQATPRPMTAPATLPGPPGARKAPSRAKGAPEYHPDYKRALDAFHALFLGARHGASPTWDQRRRARLNALVVAHGADELVRRARIMFESGARGRWPAESGGDLDTLDRHFDRFADASGLLAVNKVGERIVGARDLLAMTRAEEMRDEPARGAEVPGPRAVADGDVGAPGSDRGGHRGVDVGARRR